MSAVERFMEKIVPEPNSGCWLWTACVNHNGYAMLAMDGKPSRAAHRWYYELLHGPLAPGLELDHLCRVRSCVNPAHLEPVSHQANIDRGAKRKSECCKRGHPMVEGNLYLHPRKKLRQCLTCKRENGRLWMAAKRKKVKNG